MWHLEPKYSSKVQQLLIRGPPIRGVVRSPSTRVKEYLFLSNGIGIQTVTQVTQARPLSRCLATSRIPSPVTVRSPPRAQKTPYAERAKTTIGAATFGRKGDARDVDLFCVGVSLRANCVSRRKSGLEEIGVLEVPRLTRQGP